MKRLWLTWSPFLPGGPSIPVWPGRPWRDKLMVKHLSLGEEAGFRSPVHHRVSFIVQTQNADWILICLPFQNVNRCKTAVHWAQMLTSTIKQAHGMTANPPKSVLIFLNCSKFTENVMWSIYCLMLILKRLVFKNFFYLYLIFFVCFEELKIPYIIKKKVTFYFL